ncbi:MAG: methyltransferase domain-containing protein [Acidimicrobiia bacterium]|nr:methyltransferase domain-containing protein [Acidimicrobiia bacterium]
MPGPDHEVYTHTHQPVVLASHGARTAEEAAAFLLNHLTPGMRVLDLGCGPGSITIGLARYVAPALVVGVDNSEPALAKARRRADEESVANIRFERADVYDLPFEDDSFDVVYAHQLLQHLADPVQALREANRVLVSGGYVAVRDADYGTMTYHPPQPGLDAWLADYHDLARSNGGEPDAGRRLMEWVRAAGFTDIHPTASTWLYATPEARAEWAELWAKRRLGDRPVSAETAEAFQNWAAAPDGWFAFINGEVLARSS